MNDEQFFDRLARMTTLPNDLRAEAGRRQMQIVQRRRLHARRLVRPTRTRADCADASGEPPLHVASIGALALSRAVSRPGQWVALPRGRSTGVWRLAIAHAVKQIADGFDDQLADTLAPRREDGQGTHLRAVNDERGECVQIMWQPGAVAVAPL